MVSQKNTNMGIYTNASFSHNRYLQIIVIPIKIDTIQHVNIKAENVTAPITVVGIALKGQADLNSIMVPLEVLV